MPCDSSYLEPSENEINRKLVCELIVFLDCKLNIKTPPNIILASDNCYGEGVDLNSMVVLLCKKLSKLTEKQENEIIYDARNKMSRKLADWWEEHQKADAERVKEEAEFAKKNI